MRTGRPHSGNASAVGQGTASGYRPSPLRPDPVAVYPRELPRSWIAPAGRASSGEAKMSERPRLLTTEASVRYLLARGPKAPAIAGGSLADWDRWRRSF